MKVDASILGFTVHAAPDRIVGEIETVETNARWTASLMYRVWIAFVLCFWDTEKNKLIAFCAFEILLVWVMLTTSTDDGFKGSLKKPHSPSVIWTKTLHHLLSTVLGEMYFVNWLRIWRLNSSECDFASFAFSLTVWALHRGDYWYWS